MDQQRTRLGLMSEILALALGRPVDAIERDIQKQFPGRPDAPLTEAEYLAERAKLTAELPAIRAWIAQGSHQAPVDRSRVDEIMDRIEGLG